MKLRYWVHQWAADPKKVTRADWRVAEKSFMAANVVGLTPIQAARVLDASLWTRYCVDALAAKKPHELAALVCGLLAERRIPKRRKGGAS